MAFYGAFPSTAGPNDPPPPQLTQQQYALAFQHFQFAAQMHWQQTPTFRTPHLPPFPGPVVDPALLPTPPVTTDARLIALERELDELKTQKRTHSSEQEPSPKRRKKSKKQPSPYILKDSKNLSRKQIEVRKNLMRKMKKELILLTNMNNSNDSSSGSDSDASSPQPSRPRMAFDFTANVDHPVNIKIITRAADLLWKEQSDTTSATFSLPHEDVRFTHSDLADFGKTNFRSWKKTWKTENDPERAAAQARQASKDRQSMRRRELKQNSLSAVKEYKKIHKKNPACILESDWMSDEISALETDDGIKKKARRQLLVQKARFGPEQQTAAVWEVVRPEFQSLECIGIKDELDRIVKERKQKTAKKPRPSVPRINLGNTHSRIPTGTLWPFMVSQDWYDATVEGNAELEQAFTVYTENPAGFGEEGYTGDDERHEG
ncbi:hypothetical protein B0H11DRAFT_2275318 [Mycena galericulata]|nr:hypothetical protein B0H11DRAFT_2275318 [Mycena galericulata]